MRIPKISPEEPFWTMLNKRWLAAGRVMPPADHVPERVRCREIEDWTFRRKVSLLTIRPSANSEPATRLRFDTGGGHFILKRQ